LTKSLSILLGLLLYKELLIMSTLKERLRTILKNKVQRRRLAVEKEKNRK